MTSGGSQAEPSGGRATGGSTASTGGAALNSTGGRATGGIPSSGGTSTGGRATGGSATGGVVTGGQGSGGTGPFVLSWQDDFNTLDTSAWQLQTFTWDGNQAQFSTAERDGGERHSHHRAHRGTQRLGQALSGRRNAFDENAHLRQGFCSNALRDGLWRGLRARALLHAVPELRLERDRHRTPRQLEQHARSSTPWCISARRSPTARRRSAPRKTRSSSNLGFNAETDFHLYDIEWTPAGVKYFADGVLLRTWTANIARLRLPETILLTIWASSSAAWAGALTPSSAPTSADIDWIKVYSWNG